MHTESDRKALLEECRPMWEQDKDSFALVKTDTGFAIYNKEEDGFEVIEIDEVYERVKKNMLEAGVEILDEIPDTDPE